ncbi:MAG TPA: hypothetical protein VI137_01920 [Pseudolabrys sp.]
MPTAFRSRTEPEANPLGIGKQQRGKAEQQRHDLREHALRCQQQTRRADAGADNRRKNQAYEGSIKWWQLRTIGQRGKHGGRHDRCEIGDGREVRRHAGRD